MLQSLPHVELSINSDGSVTVRTNARVTIESPAEPATAPTSSNTLRPDDVARRLARLENHDPATLAGQTYKNMVGMGYRAAPMRENAKATYIRMVCATEGRSVTLYMDSAGLFSASADQKEFALGLEGGRPGARHTVYFPFTLGQNAIDRVAHAFKEQLNNSG
jgi:hypothetical protein